MGENALHRLIAELLRPMLARFFAERRVTANVGPNQFVSLRVRLALGVHGDELFPTEAEAERAEKERERAEKERDRAGRSIRSANPVHRGAVTAA